MSTFFPEEPKKSESGLPRASWTTGDEMKFLQKLGEHRPNRRPAGPIHKVHLLKGYIRGAYRRRNWADLDRVSVLMAAERFLLDAERRMKADKE